ncbi:class I SAM-dependent methyltransferase [Oricola cellulosilytica]|uniref:Class I SAM-dependent methyltransferase n=1 Tax=Oricola cellulosilytica TaxID=1429082 RepID=A0A4R0PFC2_9HYPH|nr:class I SAM-dependent methyltransferase [Oricola cellulosilytica]TCD15358.1 class I SAM-dependent methyltransferase [Oricola cellulosilytica]
MADFSEFARNERSGWADGEIADAYNARFGALADEAAGELLDMTDVGHGTAVLDLCCGGGGLSAAALIRGAQVTGIDFSPHMIAEARLRAPEARLLEGDAQSLPIDAHAFDVVLSNFGIQHTPDHDKAYAEVFRVLRPGGSFAMTCWDARTPEGAFGLMMQIVRKNADFSQPPPSQPGLFHFADRGTAEQSLAKHGLRLQDHRILQLRWRLRAPEEFFENFALGTVGVRMLIASQPEEAKERISRAAVREVETRFATGDGFEVPVPAAAIVARKS